MNIMLQRFFHYKRKMTALRTIAIEVFAFVPVFLKSCIKHLLRLFDLHPDLRQIGQLHGRTVFINQGFQVKIVKLEVTVLQMKIFLRKVEGLMNQVGVRLVGQLKITWVVCHL